MDFLNLFEEFGHGNAVRAEIQMNGEFFTEGYFKWNRTEEMGYFISHIQPPPPVPRIKSCYLLVHRSNKILPLHSFSRALSHTAGYHYDFTGGWEVEE